MAIYGMNVYEEEGYKIYNLAIDLKTEGWSIKSFETLEEIVKEIKMGNTHGNEFKIFKELRLNIEE